MGKIQGEEEGVGDGGGGDGDGKGDDLYYAYVLGTVLSAWHKLTLLLPRHPVCGTYIISIL